jgi:hypothetical protein
MNQIKEQHNNESNKTLVNQIKEQHNTESNKTLMKIRSRNIIEKATNPDEQKQETLQHRKQRSERSQPPRHTTNPKIAHGCMFPSYPNEFESFMRSVDS